MAVLPGDVVISEFRFLGPAGGNDEFIELYNPRNFAVDLNGLRIMGSNDTGGTSSRATLGNIMLLPGQKYLLVNSGASAGLLALQDATYGSGITDNGGIAVTLADQTTIIDAVGLSAGSAYKEGTTLAPLSGTANQSYERRDNGCTDTNNNVADFLLNASSSNPQNSSSPLIPCLVVTNVTSAIADGTYTTSAIIDINITFSGIVSVTGVPALVLETGVIDRQATYLSGSGSTTLTFRYTVTAGDSSPDLDYVGTNSLVLNGGTIFGAVGNAILTLPSPGTTGSLGANKNIVIDNGVPPSLSSFRRQASAANPTNADTLSFVVTFSEVVTNVDVTDFLVHPNTTPPTTTATVTGISPVVNANSYTVTVSGGDLAGFNGTVGVDLSATQNITDVGGNPLPAGEPSTDETYTVDNVAPTVTINQAAGQVDPASGVPVNFTVVFSESINVSTFIVSDINQTGTAAPVSWSITSSGSNTFTVSAISVGGNGTLIPILAAGVVSDLAGNTNTLGTSTDNTVTYLDTVAPTVTVNQASTQADPTSVLPIRFSVVFSEPIIASIFTPADITQNGTATGIMWSITNSGDNRNFTLSATALTGSGTLIPSIAANRVTDLVGNINVASTSTDNSVTHTPAVTPTRTPTRVPTQTVPPTLAPQPRVAINEFVPHPGHDWNNDGVVNVGDEYIEIINHGTISVDLNGYSLDDELNIGSSLHTLPSITLDPGERIVFYGSETNLLLSDGGDSVRLLRPNGDLVDLFNYTVVNYPDQSFCRLPDNGGLDDWSRSCFPTPGLRNALNGNLANPSIGNEDEPFCPIADTLPIDFFLAECDPFGHNIWSRFYWDTGGWFGEMSLPHSPGKWETFVD